MPILEIRKVSAGRSVALWHITEELPDLLEGSRLNKEEQAYFASVKNEIKQKEWLSGRLTVRALLDQLNIPYQGMQKNEQGKPILTEADGEISLTHSYPYAAAIYDEEHEVGIDLEQPTPKLKLIARKFLSDRELEFAKEDITRLCIYWCAKEALYKIYSKRGLIFKENLFIQPFDPQKEGLISGSIIVNGNKKKYNLQYIVEQDHVLVYNV